MNSWQYRYETGWINRSDWTNVHLGSNTMKNTDSSITHNLNQPLLNLLVKVFVSSDGTDANSMECFPAGSYYGWTNITVDNNNITVQTATLGLVYYDGGPGTATAINTQDWYYKVKVYFLG